MSETMLQIGLRFDCEKALRHSYLPVYDGLFSPIRDKPIQLLEIGVASGRSLKMWLEYFPNATIHGMDLAQQLYPVTEDLTDERIRLHTCDATTKETANLFPSNYFDIIIDDASHVPEEQRKAHLWLWPALKWGGYYIVEDVVSMEEAIRLHDMIGGKIVANLRDGEGNYRADDILVVIHK